MLEQTLLQDSLLGMFSHVFFIVITWMVLQSLNFDQLFRGNKVFEARVLIIFITIAIGSTVSNFFLDFLSWAQQLVYIF
ncbi:DUF1146 domain-containing protein [Gracilibacillus oryzae]|uniref:DUF1146 domain-containing protein n=1 Tax=Gracilibacillus oryzae TaxID=1672701 RepID=A0A7C8L1B0_9BACI|nr:DUF1146 family protein [Gracilibacillus oryzae]KAB8126698.1 DUF1146 domain-containing protein [Gracilibacillus oryzae]